MKGFPVLCRLARDKRVTLALLLCLGLLALVPVVADTGDAVTITPSVNDLALEEGETITETVTVVVPAGASSSKVDVYLLADTTGSMSEPIGAVQAGASAIVDGLIAELPDVDLAFGAGDYKDFPSDAYAFRHQVSLTKATASVKVAIAAWAADGGADGSEGQFFALDQLAGDVDPVGGTIGWREGAERIIVWFGDAPGHDPVCAAISGLGYDITEGSVIAKLGVGDIGVVAISTLSGYSSGLDDDPTWDAGDYLGSCTLDGTAGQATRIAAATGGTHMSGVNSSAIVDEIKNLVTAQVTTINRLSLRATGGTAPFVTSILPADYGPLASDITHTLPFDLTFDGVEPCAVTEQVYTGTIDVVADGSVVAQKLVTITVPACEGPSPSPSPSPSLSPSPGPPLGDCTEGIVNGGFEYESGDWYRVPTAYRAQYSTALAHTGDGSMRLGIVDPADNVYSYSVARQTVSIPADTVTVTLGFWAYPTSGDPAVLSAPGPRSLQKVQMMGFLPYDMQYVLILDNYSNWIGTLLWECTDTQNWIYHQFDLSRYVGRTIKVQFGAYNTGYGGVTSIYVDDVSLQMCKAGQAGPTGTPTATETPFVTATHTPIPMPVSDLMLPLIHKDSEYPPSTPSPTPEIWPTPTTGPYPYPTYGVWRSG